MSILRRKLMMTIKELMAQVEPERVSDAFLLIDYTFSAENFENTLLEKHKSIPKLKEVLKENIRLFAECIPNDNAEPYTIFIMLTPSNDYEEQHKKELSTFAICDTEMIPVIDKDFHIFDNKGEATISHYGFDSTLMQDMANYTIAKSSLDEFGAEICAAKILSELFFWGWLPEQREKAIEDLHERLSKPIDKKELVDSKPLEELMREHEEEFLLYMSEDEKAYHLAKKRFKDDTEDIRKRYSLSVREKIHKQYIDAIKTEYKNRICDEEQ